MLITSRSLPLRSSPLPLRAAARRGRHVGQGSMGETRTPLWSPSLWPEWGAYVPPPSLAMSLPGIQWHVRILARLAEVQAMFPPLDLAKLEILPAASVNRG